MAGHPEDAEIRFLTGTYAPMPEAARCQRSVAELDLAARAWLDTLVNSQEGPKLSPDDRCRVVWSVEALGKELSAR